MHVAGTTEFAALRFAALPKLHLCLAYRWGRGICGVTYQRSTSGNCAHFDIVAAVETFPNSARINRQSCICLWMLHERNWGEWVLSGEIHMNWRCAYGSTEHFPQTCSNLH